VYDKRPAGVSQNLIGSMVMAFRMAFPHGIALFFECRGFAGGGELISVPYMAPLGVFRLYTLSMLLHKRFSGWAIFSDFLKKVMG
jgi:hypothetical protein